MIPEYRDDCVRRRIWLDEKNRIASFHEIDGGRMLEFVSAGMFMSFIDDLMKQTYLFQ